MIAAHALRRAILGSLGLGSLGLSGAACSQARGTADGTEVVLPPPGSADPVATRPSAERSKPTEVGYVKGPLGFHRAGPEACDPTIDRPACRGDEPNKFCSTDADCAEHPHGKCTSGMGQIGAYCGCMYSCASDADCPETGGDHEPKQAQVCVCRGALGDGAESSVCAAASCRADSDCESDVCGVSTHFNGCYKRVELACRTSADTCKTTKDCQNGGQCAVGRGSSREGDAGRSAWSCQGMTCVIGRPLVVDGGTARASHTARTDWCAGTSRESGVDAVAAAFWLEAAALEHASVASFARFSLQLLALGAPPALLEDAQRAALDEIEHARLAYGLASRFSGRASGPGKLPEATAPIATDVADVVRALVHEGCVGETLGAIEATLQLESSSGDARAALARIAPDEARHADLAWRTLAWLLAEHGPAAATAATEAFDQAIVELELGGPPERQASPANGVLLSGAIRRARSVALHEVVRPLAGALLGASRSRPT